MFLEGSSEGAAVGVASGDKKLQEKRWPERGLQHFQAPRKLADGGRDLERLAGGAAEASCACRHPDGIGATRDLSSTELRSQRQE